MQVSRRMRDMSTQKSPLQDLLSRNAPLTEFQGWDMPAAMRSIGEEVRTAVSGSAIFDASAWGRIRLSGRDGLDLLHRLSTNDLLSLKHGETALTVLTTEKGRIVDAIRVLRRGEDCLLLTSIGAEDLLLGWIEKYTITEDVELKIVTGETCMVSLLGPGALQTLETVREGSSRPEGFAPGDVIPGSASEIHLVVPAAGGERLWSHFTSAGVVPIGIHAREILRIMHGVPGRPGELNLDFTPYDVGLTEAISYTKGCYIGQEVIARIDTYQKARRSLIGLSSRAPAVAPGTLVINAAGEEAGRVTSWSSAGLDDWWFGLAVVRSDRARHGETVTLQGLAASATVQPFPLTIPPSS